MTKKRGGARKGSGAKQKYGETTETVSIRVPKTKVDEFKKAAEQLLKCWASGS